MEVTIRQLQEMAPLPEHSPYVFKMETNDSTAPCVVSYHVYTRKTYPKKQVQGYIRGRPLCVNHLVHLPGVGNFRLSKISKAKNEPAPLKEARGGKTGAMETEAAEEEEVLARADPSKMEALTMLAEVDELAGEQTWPTEEEEAAAAMRMEDESEDEDENKNKKKKKEKLLKRMSEYQASWFEGDEDEEDGKESVEGSDDEEDDEDDGSLNGMDTITSKTATEQDESTRKTKKKLEDDELEFPDEVQTPDDLPARERFARYRALKSFRTSPWNPYESLPRWVCMYMIEAWKRRRRRHHVYI